MYSTTKRFVLAHKFWFTLAVAALLFGVWFAWGRATSTTGETRYVLGTVTEGTIVSAVSASGQVNANQQLDIKPKVSGQVTNVAVTAGQHVAAGALIAQIDSTDAQKAVRDAQANLDSAKLSLAKLQEPVDSLTLSQAQDQLAQSQTALTTDYQVGDSDITNAFLDLPSIMTGIQNVDFGFDAGGSASQWNIDYYGTVASTFDPRGGDFRNEAYDAYQAARTSYDQTFADYKAAPSSPNTATTEKLLTETYNTSVLIANSLKSTYTLIQFYSDQLTENGKTPKAAATANLASLNTFTGKLSPHISSMLGDTNTIANDKTNISEKQQSQQKVQAGVDAIDIQSSQLSLQQRQNALQDAQDALADYNIRAPFDGTIAAIAVKKFDQAGSGSAIATIITTSQIAELSLNEVDAAKIALHDKATLTFDAIPDLSLTGSIAEIDPVGTVSQGVVSYEVKITFDTQDSQVKSGMTVNAAIQNAVHQNVLEIPQSAIKTQNGQSFVQVFSPPLASTSASAGDVQGILSLVAPQMVPVQLGISDDTNTEIISGLAQGDQIVTRTVTAAPVNTAAAAGAGALGGGSGNRGGGIRIP